MRVFIRLIMCVFVLSFFTIKAHSFSPNTEQTNQHQEAYDPVPNIMHHISDAHQWHLWGEGDNAFSFPSKAHHSVGCLGSHGGCDGWSCI